jgi:hypothetical protein
MAEFTFNFQKLLDDAKNCLLKPKEFFTSMPVEGGYIEPVLKALIYGIAAGVIGFILTLVRLNTGSVFGGLFSVLFGSIISAVIGLFIGGIILLVISAICGGKTNFEVSIRISAAIMVLMPIGAAFGIFSRINVISSLLTFILTLYGLYMVYLALISRLEARQSTAKIVCLVIAIIPVIALIAGLAC